MRSIRSLRFLSRPFDREKRESIYFYTFHKCASTLFGGYVLKNISGLRHVDYSRQIYRGELTGDIVFKPRGVVYGPIRLSADPLTPEYHELVSPTSHVRFVRGKTALFLIRDPRDILISAYYSFGYSHTFSRVEATARRQALQREAIRAMSLDQYALASASDVLGHFETLIRLHEACPRSVVLKYEDMIHRWHVFSENLTRIVPVKPRVLKKIYAKSRPGETEDRASHRRSGRSGQFRRKLKPETIAALNDRLKPLLDRFQYLS